MSDLNKTKEAWLSYVSADPNKSDYYLNKWLNTLSVSELEKLLKEFERLHP